MALLAPSGGPRWRQGALLGRLAGLSERQAKEAVPGGGASVHLPPLARRLGSAVGRSGDENTQTLKWKEPTNRATVIAQTSIRPRDPAVFNGSLRAHT